MVNRQVFSSTAIHTLLRQPQFDGLISHKGPWRHGSCHQPLVQTRSHHEMLPLVNLARLVYSHFSHGQIGIAPEQAFSHGGLFRGCHCRDRSLYRNKETESGTVHTALQLSLDINVRSRPRMPMENDRDTACHSTVNRRASCRMTCIGFGGIIQAPLPNHT